MTTPTYEEIREAAIECARLNRLSVIYWVALTMAEGTRDREAMPYWFADEAEALVARVVDA